MRTYEALYIVRPDLGDDEIQTIADEVSGLVTSNNGAVVRSEIMGKRKLAYEVKKQTEGVYVLLRFESEPSGIEPLKNYFRLSDNVIRELVVHFDERELRLEAEQQRRKEAELQSGRAGRGEDDEDEDEGPRRRRRRDEDED